MECMSMCINNILLEHPIIPRALDMRMRQYATE